RCGLNFTTRHRRWPVKLGKSDFDQAVEFVLQVEGGYSNHPKDRGGETRWGISKASFPDLDIKNLTVSQAKEIYRQHYWNRCRCDEVAPPINAVLFDAAVNHG